MDSDAIGRLVSLSCGQLGVYQGKIASIDMSDQSIALTNVFHDGKPSKHKKVTFQAADITNLEYLEEPSEEKQQQQSEQQADSAFSTVRIPKSAKKKKSASEAMGGMADKLAAHAQQGGRNSAQRSGSFKQQQQQVHRGSPANYRTSPRKGMMEQHRGTPNRRERERIKDDDCFGCEIDEDIHQEFDFEKNLALFDKRLVLKEIQEDEMANQPDVVRLVDHNLAKRSKDRDGGGGGNSRHAPEPKYRNDENVLNSLPAQYRLIETGEMPPPGEYVTDAGLVVPAVSVELRARLERQMDLRGLRSERVTELTARAACEFALQLFGGAHRLNPGNTHQVPLAVVLCGPSRCGVYGMAAARHLASQGVATVAYLPDLPHFPAPLEEELKLYKLSGGKWTTKASELPKTPVDLVVNALEDHEMWDQEREQPWLKNARKWALKCDSQVMAIDPPTTPDEPLLPIKVCLVPGLPLWQNHSSNTYMVNLAVPKKVYREVGVKYGSPFGAKTCVQITKIA